MSKWFSGFSISRQLYSYLENEKRKLTMKKKERKKERKESQVIKQNDEQLLYKLWRNQ